MKNYIKPEFEYIELRAEERLAGSLCTADEIRIGSCPDRL